MRFAPEFIEKKIVGGQIAGSFSAAVVLVDIIGFTESFHRLSELGVEGAELISRDVSHSLSAAVEACSGFGGFPVSFAGDAVVIVFPGGSRDASSAVKKIENTVSSNLLPLKTSMAEGTLIWDAIPMDGWTFCSYQGSAVRDAAIAGASSITACSQDHAEHDFSRNQMSDNKVPAVFSSPDLFSGGFENEFRQVISIFVSIENRRGISCPRGFQELVLQTASELGGYVSGLETGSDANRLLVVFGAPVTREDDALRADMFLRRMFTGAAGRMKAGTSCGIVFSGIISTPFMDSYTVLGPSVNLAARLHSSAGWNTVYSCPVFSRTSRLGVVRSSEITLKGFAGPVQSVVLSPWKERKAQAYSLPPLLERDELLGDLEKSLGNSGSRILVTGVTGMGKTRLADELVSKMHDCTFIRFRGESAHGGTTDIFAPWLSQWLEIPPDGIGGLSVFREKLYRFVDQLDNLKNPTAGEVVDELLRTESVLAALIGIHQEGSLYNGLDPYGRFQNTVSVIAALIRGHELLRRTIVLIDDFQWIGSDSADVLKAVFAELSTEMPSVLLFARPEKIEEADDLGLSPERIELSPLSIDASRLFIQWSLSRQPSELLLEWFHNRTEGIPFFMEQYARMLTSASVLPDEESFPGNIHALLVSRLDRLEPDLKEMVLVAGILGRDFHPEILKRLNPCDSFNEIMKNGVSERIWEPASQGIYRFIHILLQEVACNLQLHSERRKLHRRAADVIIQIWGTREEKYTGIAFHLEQADMLEEASEWYIRAGRFFISRCMTSACLDQMQKVLDLSLDVSRRITAHHMIYDLHSMNGDRAEAYTAVETAASEKNLQPFHLAEIKMMRLNLATNMGKPQEAQRYLAEMEKDANCLKFRPQMLHHKGRIFMLQGKTEEGMLHLETVYNELKDGVQEERLVAAKALGNMAGCQLRLKKYGESEKALQQVLSYAVETGNLMMETTAVGNLALVYKYLPDRTDDTMAMSRRHLQLARKTGSRFLELQAVGNLGAFLERISPSEEAFRMLRQAVDLSRKYGGSEALSVSLASLGGALYRVGKLKEALPCFDESLLICKKHKLELHRPDYVLERTIVLLDMGRLDSAEKQLAEVSLNSIPRDYYSNYQQTMGKLLRLQNRLDQSEEVLREALEKTEDRWETYNLLRELYFTTQNRSVLEEAMAVGNDLQQQFPRWEHKRNLLELEKALED